MMLCVIILILISTTAFEIAKLRGNKARMFTNTRKKSILLSSPISCPELLLSEENVRLNIQQWYNFYKLSRQRMLAFEDSQKTISRESQYVEFTILSSDLNESSLLKHFISSKLGISINKAHYLCFKRVVEVNSTPSLSSYRLKLGDIVRVNILELESVPKRGVELSLNDLSRLATFYRSMSIEQNPSIHVIYEDDMLAIVYKPPGIHSSPYIHTIQNKLFTLEDMLPIILKPPLGDSITDILEHPKVCHRLDARVSGCIVVAKTATALQCINEQFSQHTVRKEYRALLVGPMDLTQEWIRPGPRENTWILTHPVQQKPAKTIVRLISTTACNIYRNIHHVSLFPMTGRKHQLREHCALIGCPIMGDDLYHSSASLPLFEQRAGKITDSYGANFISEESLDYKELNDNKERPGLPPVRKGVGLLLSAIAVELAHPNPENAGLPSVARTVQDSDSKLNIFHRTLTNGMSESGVYDHRKGRILVKIDEPPKFSRIISRAKEGSEWAIANKHK